MLFLVLEWTSVLRFGFSYRIGFHNDDCFLRGHYIARVCNYRKQCEWNIIFPLKEELFFTGLMHILAVLLFPKVIEVPGILYQWIILASYYCSMKRILLSHFCYQCTLKIFFVGYMIIRSLVLHLSVVLHHVLEHAPYFYVFLLCCEMVGVLGLGIVHSLTLKSTPHCIFHSSWVNSISVCEYKTLHNKWVPQMNEIKRSEGACWSTMHVSGMLWPQAVPLNLELQASASQWSKWWKKRTCKD